MLCTTTVKIFVTKTCIFLTFHTALNINISEYCPGFDNTKYISMGKFMNWFGVFCFKILTQESAHGPVTKLVTWFYSKTKTKVRCSCEECPSFCNLRYPFNLKMVNFKDKHTFASVVKIRHKNNRFNIEVSSRC